MAKHSKTNLADVALAGLASKENFRKVNLRSVKSTEVVTNNSSLPYNKLMLIRIKGQKRQRIIRAYVFVFCKKVVNGPTVISYDKESTTLLPIAVVL